MVYLGSRDKITNNFFYHQRKSYILCLCGSFFNLVEKGDYIELDPREDNARHPMFELTSLRGA